MYKAAVVCELGLEDISAREVHELIGRKCEMNEGVVLFSVVKIEELGVLCYKAQSVKRVLVLLDAFDFLDIEGIKKSLEKIDFSFWVKKGMTIDAECERIGEHSFRSVDVEGLIRQAIGAKVDFERPDVRFFVYVNKNKGYIGVDAAGFDLAQREYKVFSHAAALKGTVAYAAVRMSGFAHGKKLVSFGKSGIISIEAALYASGKAVNYYRKEKLAFLKPVKNSFFEKLDRTEEKGLEICEINYDQRDLGAARKNAKIAGVEKIINFTHMEVDWLDVKFKEGEIDVLFVQPVAGEVKRMKEFFHQAAYVVAPDGNVVIISVKEDFSSLAKEFGFVLKEERTLKRGNGIVRIQVFGKHG